MKFGYFLLLGPLVSLASWSPALAADRRRLASVPLDMPLSDQEALDNQFLEGLYQGDYGKSMPRNLGGYLGGNVKSSGLVSSPYRHIDTVLKDGRRLQLWFSSESDGRKIFGVRLDTPYIEKPTRDYNQAISEIQSAWGKPDLELSPADAKGVQQIEIFVDHTMSGDRLAAVMARLPGADKLPPKDVNDFWDSDLRDYGRILGSRFRGAIAVVNQQNGKLVGEELLLVDMVRAATVFNLGEGN